MKAVLLDLLMATMDSISVWARAVGDREAGLAWRDAVTDRMLEAGRYVPYDALLTEAAAAVRIDPNAVARLQAAWMEMEPWPDVAALDRLAVPYAFVTNCSIDLAAAAVARSGLRPAFTISAEEAGWYKPRPEIYRLAVSRIGGEPHEIGFVAGASYDALGAHAVGLRARLISRRASAAAVPDAIPIFASLDEALAVP